ncbi:unnamed protein product [Linum tenue]|uniref:Uncharacterized protein n=1 Tax=Linum tenue TaxID=586396 RepID=A0AAV0RLT8_9ROSI|nr:unnamed protein product [Linum tenue]
MLPKPLPDHSLHLLRRPPHRLLEPSDVQPPQKRQTVRHHEPSRQIEEIHERSPQSDAVLSSRQVPDGFPHNHLQDNVQRYLLEPASQLNQNAAVRLVFGPVGIQLFCRDLDLGFPHVFEQIEAVRGEKLQRGDLPDLSPVRTVRAEPEHGPVVPENMRGEGFGSVSEDPVEGGQTLLGGLPVADD